MPLSYLTVLACSPLGLKIYLKALGDSLLGFSFVLCPPLFLPPVFYPSQHTNTLCSTHRGLGMLESSILLNAALLLPVISVYPFNPSGMGNLNFPLPIMLFWNFLFSYLSLYYAVSTLRIGTGCFIFAYPV